MSPQGKKETFGVQEKKDNGFEWEEESQNLRLSHKLEISLLASCCFTLTALLEGWKEQQGPGEGVRVGKHARRSAYEIMEGNLEMIAYE